MIVAHTRPELDDALRGHHDALGLTRGRVALVPTMGALHAGHAALMDVGRQVATTVVVSIFVNPLQFGPGEDLTAYPRTLDDDLETCVERGVDVVFAPAPDTVYPPGGPRVTVDPGPLAVELEGAARPGHFRGVLTVVTKLFGLIRPDVAVFGTKDYQQLVLVRRCVADLFLPVEILGVETVRASDGLALSSRNRNLSDSQRATASALSRALLAGQGMATAGRAAVVAAAGEVLAAAQLEPEYLEVRGVDLEPAPVRGPARLLVAARIGGTRLIDNAALVLT